MGQRLVVFASPNTPSTELSPCTYQPIRAPFPPSGKGVGGKGRCACGYLGSDSVRSTDLDFSWEKNLNPYPALQATGVLGQSPKRVLLTFARTKVSPRRVGVLTKPSKRLAPPIGDISLLPNGSRGLGRGTDICRGSPRRRRNLIFSPGGSGGRGRA